METQTQKCKKLKFESTGRVTILYGVILEEDNYFLMFKTARREYKISKSLIVSIESTDKDFKEEIIRGGTS